MPLENLFQDRGSPPLDPRKAIYEQFGVLDNPFPNAAQTSGHPHLDTDADKLVDSAVGVFVHNLKSQTLAVTASQGIGKTNLLNAYEAALRRELRGKGFYIIRYLADPDPSFDQLLRSIFEHLGEDHLRKLAEEAAKPENEQRVAQLLEDIRVQDVRSMFQCLIKAKKENNEERLQENISLAYQWLLGLRVLKAHHNSLGIYYRLDTIESKTRVLHEVAVFSAGLNELSGIFLLLDELEKQGSSLSRTNVLRYLSALRALIDALPNYLFLMVALTTDALQRYHEMLPALKGRLANEVRLQPIRSEEEAVRYCKFYLNHEREKALLKAEQGWQVSRTEIVSEAQVGDIFAQLRKTSTLDGVRQRDFLNELNKLAAKRMEAIRVFMGIRSNVIE